ncbi:MAG: hypothetical protein WAQ74_01085 [Kiritimatiellia bacterium]|jgi:hypothetical protein
MKTAKEKQKAGHYEIYGETLAKFEFFEAGWNPYERYLDVDQVDLILRRRKGDRIIYREIQVKYGKLYDVGTAWEKELFDITSWRFFAKNTFSEHRKRKDYFIAYVLAHDSGYKGDIFILTPRDFDSLIGRAISSSSGVKQKVYLSRSKHEPERWFLRKKSRFDKITSASCIEVTKYRRAFDLLE